MQFHLNGFRTGDPGVSPASSSIDTSLTSPVDVLIVGCGPAGLTLAAQLAAFPSINTRIIDSKPGRLELGQADGVACRSMEMFEAFGFSERVLKEAYWVNETTFWTSDTSTPENIHRTGRVQDTEDGLSEFPHVILNQARVHDFYLDVMERSSNRLAPHYNCQLLDFEVSACSSTDENKSRTPVSAVSADYPVSVRVKIDDGTETGRIETLRTRFLIGCDGARSTVRQGIGQHLQGDSANQVWGVMDVLAVTDFPDIRFKSLVQSSAQGSMVIIPREGGYLVRLYVEIDDLDETERAASRDLTADDIVAAANRVLHPYTLSAKEVAWWSIYEIGQRLCQQFDDAGAPGGGSDPRVFIVGDACHTHSPKAGQGMNVSMADAFNLGWKLAAVLRQQSSPMLLRTYSAERQTVAQELIDFDREWAQILSARSQQSSGDREPSTDAKFQRYFVQHGRYTAGTAVQYQPSLICDRTGYQSLATGFTIGTRFHSAPVVRLSDGRPLQLGHVMKADGRWRLILFAGANDKAQSGSVIENLCRFLQSDPASPVNQYTPSESNVDAVIDVRAVFQASFRELSITDMPNLLLPTKGKLGLLDYEKVFCAGAGPDADIYSLRGIDRQRGCMVIVRPDQYVGGILPLDAGSAVSEFFAGFMLPAR